MHLPGMNFAGPGTNLDKRLTSTDAYQDWSKPVDRVDNAAYHHDLAYKYFNDKQTRNLADKMMLEEMNSIQNPTQREINERKIIEPIISPKAKFGLGVKKKIPANLKWTDQLANELHKHFTITFLLHFRRRKVIVNGIDEIWAADLIDMQSFSKFNNGIKYLLMVIDVFSKYGWIVP